MSSPPTVPISARPLLDRQRRAAVRVERLLPRREDRAFGVEDQPVEVEDDRPDHPRDSNVGVARLWFGLYLPQLRMSFDRILERTLAAEAAGFDSVWLMDHFAAPMPPEVDTLEGWTIATALAARTSTIRIGHLVLCDPFRHPVLLAKMAATLDVISNGRLELGIGWGSVPDELRTFGFGPEPPATRAAKLRETLEILELMFAGEPFDYDGAHFTLHGAQGRPVPVQARFRCTSAAADRSSRCRSSRDHADWWNCPGYALDRLDELRPLAGNARISAQHPIGLARDRGRARRRDRDRATPLRIVGRRDRGHAPTRSRPRSRAEVDAGRRGLRVPVLRLRHARDDRALHARGRAGRYASVSHDRLIVGVPREVKTDEHRVAITPDGVLEMRHHGVRVLVETRRRRRLEHHRRRLPRRGRRRSSTTAADVWARRASCSR